MRKRQTYLESEFDRFRTLINESILLNRDAIRMDRAVRETSTILGELQTHLKYLHKALESNASGIRKSLQDIENENMSKNAFVDNQRATVQQLFSDLSAQTYAWVEEFVGRMPEESNLINALPEKIDLAFVHYISNKLYEALMQCLGVHKSTLFNLQDAVQKGLAAQGISDAVESRGQAVLMQDVLEKFDLKETEIRQFVYTALTRTIKEKKKLKGEPDKYKHAISEVSGSLLVYMEKYHSSHLFCYRNGLC